MSTLLQRLAGQAIGAPAPRVRAAERMRAQVPIAMPAVTTPRMPDDGVSGANVQQSLPPHLDHNSRDDHAPRPVDLHVPAFSAPERGTPRLVTAPAVVVREVTDPAPAVATAPAPLLGEVAHAVPVKAVAGSIQPLTPPAATAFAGSEPTEVHVHIGRVEVTAVHPAAPPVRKREATTRRSVPLSDYLARRRSS